MKTTRWAKLNDANAVWIFTARRSASAVFATATWLAVFVSGIVSKR